MKEQKNIERLFQEKFKDFEVAPPEMAWETIEARLNEKKKKKRVIPFWFKASGIAASLVLGFYIYSLFTNTSEIDLKIDEKNIVIDEKNNSNQKQNGLNTIQEKQNSIDIIKEENSVLTEIDNTTNSSNKSENKDENRTTIFKNKKVNNSLYKKENALLISSNKEEEIKKTTNKFSQQSIESSTINKSVLAESNSKESEINTSTLEKNTVDFEKINNDKNSSITVEKTTNNITQDSSLIAKISEEVNALEQLLKEKEVGKNVEEKEKEMQNRWAISSNASPVYFNSSAKNSTLDAKFDSNKKGYNSNISYGVGVSYAINTKLTIRTGISTLNFNSNTEDISFYQRNNPSAIDNLSRNQRGNLINIENKNSGLQEVGFNGSELIKYTGELSQQLGYLEVPFELSYKVIDKKFSVDVIGGMSTLFLNNNSVSIVSNQMEMEIGSATNLSSIHYSTNLGMGFSYSFLKSFQANVNPMFKYQINTFTDNSNTIKPYFVGVYSGISYKF